MGAVGVPICRLQHGPPPAGLSKQEETQVAMSTSITSDRPQVKIDDKDIGSFRSDGFDHTKTTLRATSRRAGAIDDFMHYEYVDSTTEVAP